MSSTDLYVNMSFINQYKKVRKFYLKISKNFNFTLKKTKNIKILSVDL